MKNYFRKLMMYKDNHKIISILVIMFASTLYTIGVKWFIIPAGQKTGGFTGIAQILYGIVEPLLKNYISYDTGVSIFWFLLNIPVFYLGFKELGRRFAFLSFLAVITGMISLSFIPIPQIIIDEGIANDSLLSALLGGFVAGVGVGINLKIGASTGGVDIISEYLSMKYDRSFGYFSFILNFIIILITALTDSWILALYTIINLFVMTIVVDKIHTRNRKLTLMIITDYRDELIEALQKRVFRGITILPGIGAYTRKDKTILLMVVSSYELYNVTQTIYEIDKNAFTNVFKSQAVYGNFFKEKIG
ncbi:MAG TPA: YitT family protein [Haloplasmataceae bacterium]